MPEIRFENGLKKFGKTVAVKNINLKIDDKDFITLLGPSGCGKTTMLRMLAGLESPTTGNIYIDHKLVFSSEKGIDISPDKRDVGFLFQNYALWPHMTIFKNISFGLENLKWNKSKIKNRVEELLVLLKIEPLADRYPSELSGGQQQRVAIARTMAPNPKVLFMDEPLSNLDAKLRTEMRSELKRLHLETNSTFVYVTHDQLEAMTLSTKICHMNEGEIHQYAPPLEVYNNPSNLIVADFVGNPTMNFIKTKCIDFADGKIQLKSEDLSFEFSASKAESLSIKKGDQLVLGLRPEHIELSEIGSLTGSIFSTLPSGMETIVKIKILNTTLTSVAFGDVDYDINSAVSVNFSANKYLLFDESSGKNIAMGKIRINQ
ncbi:MAG: ABC transporter ATP-binding protein [Deltaproteobacteria bacterium]|jgi:multiple sugar transport system ATP-binding protein|nr:ABC transporter ATP-binding protein [Deltaproteobacteria bacterium]